MAAPMTRGGKCFMATDPSGAPKADAKAKAAKNPVKIAKTAAAPKLKASKSLKPKLPVSEWDESHIRRTKAGRDCIKELMVRLCNLHEQVFSSSPAFDVHGNCRMKFAGAGDLTWSQLLDDAPSALEAMQLDCICL